MKSKKNPKRSTIKGYVLDTNVLLHDPESLFQFQNNHVFIPVEVLEEIDNFKTEQTERGANSRRVNRSLDNLFAHDPARMREGVDLPNRGKLFVVINPLDRGSKSLTRLLSQFPDLSKKDNRILCSALYVQDTQPPPVILVTKDINMRLKALALGLRAEDYLTDKKHIVADGAYRDIQVSEESYSRFLHDGRITLKKGEGGAADLNEYVFLVNAESPNHRRPCRHYGNGEFRRLLTPQSIQIPHGINFTPRSAEQSFLIDALMDPSIALVTVLGKAGTGKTLLSIGTALASICREGSPYDGLTISRPVVVMGKDVGALPGGLQEKLDPYLRPYYDALAVLFPNRRPAFQEFVGQPAPMPSLNPSEWTRKDRKHFRKQQVQQQPSKPNGGAGGSPKPWEILQRSGVLEIEALGFIRGRSIPRRFFLVDEAQQLTPHEAKTIITRMSEGSKIVFMGDPQQIDNPFVDSRSNGLVYTQSRTRNQALAASVRLFKGERSPLAEMGATLL
jgi:PhoH-like ATPase